MKKYTDSTILLICLALAACVPERGESEFPDQEIGEDGDGEILPPISGEIGAGPGAGTMTGTWLKVHEASSCVLGQEQLTLAYYLVEIEEDGLALREHRRLCQLDLSPVLGFRPVAAPEVLESIEFPMVDRGLITRLVAGGAYSSATEVGLWGGELDDPLEDILPVDPEDERVVDGEGDGNPGVTLQLEGSGCERYMGQRQVVRYFGRVEAPNDLVGHSATTTQTAVYGASAPVCELAPAVEANDDHSRFRMVRIDGLGGAVQADHDGDGEISCEEAGVYIDAIWDPREPDDDLCDR